MAGCKNEEIRGLLVESLGLTSEPVGIGYLDEPDLEGDSRKRYVCLALKHAFKGETLCVSRRSLACMGGVHWLGFMDLEEILVAFLVMLESSFEDSDVARRWFRSVPEPPFGKAEYVVLKPLAKWEDKPDLVALKVSPPQAEDLLSLLSFKRGDLSLEQRFTATCQGAITNPIATGKPSIFIPDAVSRKFARFADDDMIVSMPFAFAEEVVRNIPGWVVDLDDLFGIIVELTRGMKGGTS